MRETLDLPAIKDSDLRSILDHYGFSDKLDNEDLQCESCSESLNWHNIGAMLVKGQKLILFCNFSECIDEATRSSNNGH